MSSRQRNAVQYRTAAPWNRRTWLGATAGAIGVSWITCIADQLAAAEERAPNRKRPDSLVVLWLAGGPSQLETFDPHPNTRIAAGTPAIDTRVPGIQLGAGLEHIADQMDAITLVRHVVSKEGDHERGAYNVKTGYRPDPTLVHPSIGAILCHQLPQGRAEIPRHIAIFPDRSYGRGGYLGAVYDAYQVHAVRYPLPDMSPRVNEERFATRMRDLEVVERAFHRHRIAGLEQQRMLHRATMDRAVTMMNSEQLVAFDIEQEPRAVQDDFGDSEFGRGCLAALRLLDAGVRCVEITLGGWDSHINNHEIHAELNKQLDPAFGSLIKHLRERDRLDRTLVVCGGEFGRTPKLNGFGGRDHWPHGFSLAMAGGGLRPGVALGATDPDGGEVSEDQGVPVEDIHATLMHLFGLDPSLELDTPVGRPMKLSQGNVRPELIG